MVPVALFSSPAKVSLLTPVAWPDASLETTPSSDWCCLYGFNRMQKTSFCSLDPDPGKISAYADAEIAPGTNEVNRV